MSVCFSSLRAAGWWWSLTVSLCVSADLELPQDSYVEVVVAFVDLTHCWLRLIGPDYSVSGDGRGEGGEQW